MGSKEGDGVDKVGSGLNSWPPAKSQAAFVSRVFSGWVYIVSFALLAAGRVGKYG
jgi:hypothetical protein